MLTDKRSVTFVWRTHMKRKQIGMLIFLAVIVVLLFVTANTPGVVTDPENYQCSVYATVFALLPPVIAIGLALITKEVYTSLLAGIITGGLLYSNFNLELMIGTIFFQEDGGMVYKLADAWNVGILVFLVMLGILVSMLNKAGGSAAFGKWASKHIKTRIGAQISVMVLGILIFVDDYFNCLTVGSVMRPVTDRHKVSRAKLSYIIDATAAPVCIIAPISSWAAAVTSSVPEDAGINGFAVFLQTIPYNLYAILTLVMVLLVTVLRVDFGPMKKHEDNAAKGDLFTCGNRVADDGSMRAISTKGTVVDLAVPVVALIVCCVTGMIYTGGFFEGESFVKAFAGCDASLSLSMGSAAALLFTIIFYLVRRVLTFQDCMNAFPEGFKAMISPVLILTFAWTLSNMTSLLGAREYVSAIFAGSASHMTAMLPAIVFLVAIFLAFSTGTSWGTFGILLPIIAGINLPSELLVITVSACLAGAVCGDHCSPISDTTIMSSAGAQCDHMNHVTTQIPYVAVAATVSFIGYCIAGVVQNSVIVLAVSFVIMVAVLAGVKKFAK